MGSTIIINLTTNKMPNVTFNITTQDIDEYAKSYQYQDLIDGSPNPETKAAFAKRMAITYFQDRIVTQYKADAVAAANITTPVIT